MIKLSRVPALFREDKKEQKINSSYGYRIHPVTGAKQDFHTGTDYPSASRTRLVSPCDGVVTLAKLYTTGYGGRVLIYNGVANVTVFVTHLEALHVKTGDVVSKGQLIALSGGGRNDKYAGTSTGPHLHIGVIKGRATSIPGKEDKFYYDPEKFDWDTLNSKIKWHKERGVLTLDTNVNVRVEASTSAKVYRLAKKGEELDYIAWGNDDKYTWMQLTNGYFVAYGERGKEIYAWDSNSNKKPGKINSKPLPKPIAKGDKVKLLKAISYDTGKKFNKWRRTYDVISVNGNRVVIGVGKKITAPVHKDNLEKIS